LLDNPDAWYPSYDPYDDNWDPDDPDATPRPTRDPNATPRPTKVPIPDYTQRFEIPTIGVDFVALRAINPDVCGWLYLPDSAINYPIVRPSREYSTTYYLSHTWDHQKNISGTLFTDLIGSGPFTAQNSFIHGHRMNNGSMFGALNKFKTQSYYNKHQILQLYTPEQNYLVYVFAAFTAEIDGYETTVVFDGETAFQKYLDNSVKKSNIKASYQPSAQNRIVTLSTCVVQQDTKRFMVQGYLVPMS